MHIEQFGGIGSHTPQGTDDRFLPSEMVGTIHWFMKLDMCIALWKRCQRTTDPLSLCCTQTAQYSVTSSNSHLLGEPNARGSWGRGGDWRGHSAPARAGWLGTPFWAQPGCGTWGGTALLHGAFICPQEPWVSPGMSPSGGWQKLKRASRSTSAFPSLSLHLIDQSKSQGQSHQNPQVGKHTLLFGVRR